MTNLTKIAGVLLAVLVVATGAAAALPGNAPADSNAGQADDHAPDDPTAANESAADDADDDSDAEAERERHAEADQHRYGPNATGAEMRANGEGPEQAGKPDHAGERGPPLDMPAQVPDFVTELHQLINDWLSGDQSEPLGPQVSDLTPGNDSADDSDATPTAANASQPA